MTETADLLNGFIDEPAEWHPTSDRINNFVKFSDCDVCGQVKPDVDLWAEHPETLEQIWLCVACGDW